MSNLFTLENLLFYGVPLLFSGIAVILLIAAARLKTRAASAKNWPGTQGTVLSALIEKSDSDGTPYYRPIIAYRYQVNGRDYQCDNLAFGKQTSAEPDERGRLKAEEKARQYPVGRSVDVHYNPANPADTVLEVRTAGVRGLIGVALVMVVIGAGWSLGANWLIRQ